MSSFSILYTSRHQLELELRRTTCIFPTLYNEDLRLREHRDGTLCIFLLSRTPEFLFCFTSFTRLTRKYFRKSKLYMTRPCSYRFENTDIGFWDRGKIDPLGVVSSGGFRICHQIIFLFFFFVGLFYRPTRCLQITPCFPTPSVGTAHAQKPDS